MKPRLGSGSRLYAGLLDKGHAHTNGIESFWSMLEGGDVGICHQMSAKHLDQYVGELAGRHNHRSMDTVEQMQAMASRMAGKRLKYRDMVA